jgi:hypothetical protein
MAMDRNNRNEEKRKKNKRKRDVKENERNLKESEMKKKKKKQSMKNVSAWHIALRTALNGYCLHTLPFGVAYRASTRW